MQGDVPEDKEVSDWVQALQTLSGAHVHTDEAQMDQKMWAKGGCTFPRDAETHPFQGTRDLAPLEEA